MNQELFDQGLKTRREVLGAEYVDAAIQNADDFNRDMQELVTQYAWGEIWNRPGLDRKTRSLLNLAMLTALNRPHELKLHLRGALTNGVSKDEIKEVFLQTAVYCGAPAAIDSFRTAKEVFKELGV
ncbi:4-carboxymuconolactone decarboxylase [Rhodoferax sp. OV413]|uniref:4-carboxymuconolactone decarboxylase n=1 Tax=Rhodoferax sp. OV413 TaxID=1855285 RepID=UPI0008820D40|nr:4-carboxymuconolactone decarboxylase [Rhodoferax sp. OV413]SDP91439.1 4-carboxymuconolactone decarboxylase [Rhodoferax sp. OV413]